MALKLKGSMETYNEKKQVYIDLVKNGATEEEQATAWAEMQEALVNDLKEVITAQVRQENLDQQILAARGKSNILTSEERKFFNSLSTDVGYKEEILLPESTIDRIFEDLTSEHPLLQELGLKTTGLITRIIKSDTNGAAVWGKIFGEIKGQLDAAFSEESVTQSKLTAFVVIPKDLDEYGPEWVERFVRAQITETFAVGLERGFLLGAGPVKDEPIGLIKDLNKPIDPTNGYVDKDSSGTLTFADSETTVKELAAVMKRLSVKENGKSVKVDGKVVLVVNPSDAWNIKALYTFLNANGAYVTVLPYNLRVVESEFMTQGKLLAFVKDRYDAYIGGGVKIKRFDQTLAIEDCDLFTAKQFAFGKAHDNNAAKLFDLNINDILEPETP
ncbi:phage major capsid protein [Bacillus alveayuensis]|uniref:phage major capsid protein n=1 Tax=Aeribacillus alveayuensis TaxID=279215 RepID=UPI0005D0F2F0|nr:phage major capsid protein [Bacillus alveayuensis]